MDKTKDPMGAAISDYFHNGMAHTLRVLSPQFDEDEMPIETLFRSFDDMPRIEQRALEMAKGKTIDVGAGSGCHSLALQQMGKQVTAIDISPLSVETMQLRGVKDARLQDFFAPQEETYDTILMLMNGAGMCGVVDRLPMLMYTLDGMLAPGGQVLMDSSDLRYIFEDEEGCFDPTEFDSYYGEVEYQMVYGDVEGEQFPWLYVDFNTLKGCAEACGFKAEMVVEGDHYDYLARLTRE